MRDKVTGMLSLSGAVSGVSMVMRGKASVFSVILVAAVLAFTGVTHIQASDEDDSPSLRENLLPAQQGDAKAQVFVGYLYETGQGVRQDYARAAKWYEKAARQGNATAQTQLGDMYRQGRGVPQNYVMAYMWLDLACRQGSRQAFELKKALASNMTPSQITEARRLANRWREKR